MRKLISLLLLVVVLGGGAYLIHSGKVQGPLPKKINELISGPLTSRLAQSVGSVVQTSSKDLTQQLGQIPQAATPGRKKIPVDQVSQTIQDRLSNLPTVIAEQARYEYCRQVVQDFEQRATPSPASR